MRVAALVFLLLLLPAAAAEACDRGGPVPSGLDSSQIPASPSCSDLAAERKLKVLNLDVSGDKGTIDTLSLQKRVRDLVNLFVPGSVVSVLDAEDMAAMDPDKTSDSKKRVELMRLDPSVCGDRCAVATGKFLGFPYVISGKLARLQESHRLELTLWSTTGEGGQLFGVKVDGRDQAELEKGLGSAVKTLVEPLNKAIYKDWEERSAARNRTIDAAKARYVEENDRRAIARKTGWTVMGVGGAVLALSAVGVWLGQDKSHDIQTGRLQTVQEVQEASSNIQTINSATKVVAGIGAAGVLVGLGFVVWNLDKSQPWMTGEK